MYNTVSISHVLHGMYRYLEETIYESPGEENDDDSKSVD